MADELTKAWTAVITGEAAAVYAYSIAGPRVAAARSAAAQAGYDSHETARDQALLELVAAGADPVPLPAFFELPDQVATPAQAAALLAGVESRLAVVYADLVEVLPLDRRQEGLDGALAATSQALGWGAPAGAWGAGEPS
jgi:Domain of unknown function (DUF4439)